MPAKKIFCPYVLTLFFLLNIECFTLKAQYHAIDSMRRLIETEQEDSNKVNTLNAMSEQLWKISKYFSSIDYAKNALKLADEMGYDKGIGYAYWNIGNCYSGQANYPDALTNLQAGLSVFRNANDKKGISKSLNSIGSIYQYQGNYSKSLEYFFEALTISQETGDKNMSANVLGNIGGIYEVQQDFGRALEYTQKALDIFHTMGDKIGETRVLANIGITYSDKGDYDTALVYMFKALDLSQKLGDKNSQARNLGKIGEIYADQGKYEQAMEYERNALTFNRLTGNKRYYAYILNTIGLIYSKQKQYTLSKSYLDSALNVSQKMGEKEILKDVYNYKTELDSVTGDYKAEVADNKMYNIYHDSLMNQKITQTLMNHEFDRKTDSIKAVQDKLNMVAANEKEKQTLIRNAFIGGFSITFIASGVFFFQRRRITKDKIQIEAQKKRSDELLLNILPEETAEELKASGESKAKHFDLVTVMFTDFKGFTQISETLSPTELVAELHYLFQAFDTIVHEHKIEKIKTIGDSYMAASGLPVANETHAKDMVRAALEIRDFVLKHNQRRKAENKPVFEVRIGINTGPVVAGIVGKKKFSYDIWGDTVNIASRMESSGEAGKINISGSTCQLVKNDFICTYRGKVEAKNKGEIDMYFIQ